MHVCSSAVRPFCRSSDGSRARVAGGDGAKRTARTLKIKLARHLLPCHSPVDVGAAETSVLYSSQVGYSQWLASFIHVRSSFGYRSI